MTPDEELLLYRLFLEHVQAHVVDVPQSIGPYGAIERIKGAIAELQEDLKDDDE